jgi:cell division septum initiation protein DivIVA
MSVSTAGVSGTPRPPDDLQVIYQGGENFLARAQALSERHREVENALAALNLGKSAQDAYNEATTAAAQAKKEFADAKAKADALVKNAQKQAEDIVSKANAEAMKAAEIVDRDRAALKRQMDEARAVADKDVAEAKKLKLNAAEDAAKAAKAMAEATSMQKDLSDKTKAAEAAEKDFTLKKTNVMNIVGSLMDTLDTAKGKLYIMR